MKRIRLTCLVCMVFVFPSHGAWLEWDREDYYYEGVGPIPTAGYRVLVGTNSGFYGATNDVGRTNRVWLPRLGLFPVLTNYFVVTAYNSNGQETPWSDEVDWGRTNISVSQPVTNVVLRVPSGKFYVERADTTAAWASSSTVTGPTNIVFPITGTMGFFRFRPYFVSFSNPKGGAAKLMAAKKPMFKKKPKPISSPSPVIGRVNLDPSKR